MGHGASRSRALPDGWIAVGVVVGVLAAGVGARGEVPPASAPALERAEVLIRDREFDEAAAVLRHVLAEDPANRRAMELLAFALESRGDVEEERRIRSALASEYPDDARIQSDYGRVLERSGETRQALETYRRARSLNPGLAESELEAAIARMRGRTAIELGAPYTRLSDPDATSTRAQAGASFPFRSRRRVAITGARWQAEPRAAGATTASDELALSVVLDFPSGASITAGPRFHAVSPGDRDRRDTALGVAIGGRAPLARWLEASWSGAVETPWDESAITVLYGGRTTEADGRLYAHAFSRRLLLQAGARRRRLSIVAADPASTDRPEAWQSLRLAGVDVVVWSNPGATLRGQMLDDSLTTPAAASAAVSLAYRHYDVSTDATRGFLDRIGIARSARVDEASVTATLAPRSGRFAAELRAGLGWDSERRARMRRAGGALTWAPDPRFRLVLGYEGADESLSGLSGRRRAVGVSLHADL